MSKKQRALVQRQFTKTLEAFSKHAVRDSPGDVQERAAFAKVQPGDVALDVACGPGAFVLALAPSVKFARGVDLTFAMLQRARETQREKQISNAAFDQGDAGQLPYPDNVFHLVTCQFAFHHMPKPQAAFGEMLRVCSPGGRLLVVDTIAPESDEKWELQNRIQTIRDPSHTSALRLTSFLNMFEIAGVEILRQSQKPRHNSFAEWMRRAGLDEAQPRFQEARRLVEESMPSDSAGFSPRRQDGEIILTHYEGLFLLEKRAP